MANRVLIGKASTARGGDTKYGLWISRPTKDVLTCTDDELIFNTDKGGTADIKGFFQLQNMDTSTNATTSTTTSVAANTTATINFSNFNWGFGALAFGGFGVTANNSSSAGSSGVSNIFSINSTSTSQISVTNLSSDTAVSISFSVLPKIVNVARF
jgi:hypothetical protein|tara:strand:- start:39 stop:506 length:468 start_codon:yes stop_codon:yes gene_type:complete